MKTICMHLCAPLVAFGFCSTALAKDTTEKAPAPSIHLRGNDATLGSNRSGKSLRPVAIQGTAKGDLALHSARSAPVPTPAPLKVKNAYELAFESLASVAATIAPSHGGRLEVSFEVGKNGQAEKALVHGISPELDRALTEHLKKLRFPAEHAGLFYTSKLTIRAVAVAAVEPVLKKQSRSTSKRRAKRVQVIKVPRD